MPENRNTTTISCRNVWKVFGAGEEMVRAAQRRGGTFDETDLGPDDVIAARDISFDVSRGETFVVMGLSGSGKSTLVRCISRLVEPTSGSVLIDGDDIVTMGPQDLIQLRRHKLAMVFQHFGLLPHRRVIDNVAYGLEVQGIKKSERLEKAAEIVELVGLAGWGDRYPHQLSGGMQQRVGLARALAVDPEILLFDEPFSALDPLIRREMQDELLRIQAVMHKTMIFITHDFPEAVKMGDRIAIMRAGSFVQVGTAEDIVCNPRNDYVREFTEDVPRGQVLTAATVMKPVVDPDAERFSRQVAPTTSLQTLIHLTASDEEPVSIVDVDGALVGQVDRVAVLDALDHKT